MILLPTVNGFIQPGCKSDRPPVVAVHGIVLLDIAPKAGQYPPQYVTRYWSHTMLGSPVQVDLLLDQ